MTHDVVQSMHPISGIRMKKTLLQTSTSAFSPIWFPLNCEPVIFRVFFLPYWNYRDAQTATSALGRMTRPVLSWISVHTIMRQGDFLWKNRRGKDRLLDQWPVVCSHNRLNYVCRGFDGLYVSTFRFSQPHLILIGFTTHVGGGSAVKTVEEEMSRIKGVRHCSKQAKRNFKPRGVIFNGRCFR